MKRRNFLEMGFLGAGAVAASPALAESPAIIGNADKTKIALEDFRTSGSSDWTSAFSRALSEADDRTGETSLAAGVADGAADGAKYGPTIELPRGIITLDSASFPVSNSFRISGEHYSISGIRLPADHYLVDSQTNPVFISMTGLSVIGGRGALMLRNSDDFLRGAYRIERCSFTNFSGAAICNLSSDFGRWEITHNLFSAASDSEGKITGTAVALQGAQDNSVIAENLFHGVGVGVKLLAPRVCWVYHNSFMRKGEISKRGPGVDIWITPSEDPHSIRYGGGCQISENRHGRENASPDDEILLIADQDLHSGRDFADTRPLRAPSPKRLDGVICERNYAEGPPHQPRPYARSWLGKLAGWSLANQLSTGISDEIVMPPGVTTPDLPYYRRNLVSTRYWGMAAPGTGRGMPRGWLVEDPLGLLR